MHTPSRTHRSGPPYRIVATAMLALLAVTFPEVSMGAQRLVCDEAALTDAVSKAGPGTDIVLCNRNWPDVSIRLIANGTASAPVRIRAQDPGKVVLIGKSSIAIAGAYVEIDGLILKGPTTSSDAPVAFYAGDRECSHCRLTNSAIIDFNYPDATTHRAWVVVKGQDNRIERNYFAGKSTVGAIVDVKRRAGQADLHVITRNYFSRPPVPADNGGESVKVGQGTDDPLGSARVRIEDNYFRGADGEIEMISLKASENLVKRNTVEGSRGTISLRQGRANRIEGNLILGRGISGTGGIRMTGTDHVVVNNYIDGIRPTADAFGGISLISGDDTENYVPVENAVIAFNTIVNSAHSLVFGAGGRNSAPSGVTLVNNIVVSKLGPLVTERLTLIDPTIAGNIFYGSEIGTSLSSGIIVADPMLRPDASGILRPASGSPAIGKAQASFGITTDIDGQARTAAAADAGADEVSVGGNPIEPLDACDVGPLTWSAGSDCANDRPEPPVSLIVH